MAFKRKIEKGDTVKVIEHIQPLSIGNTGTVKQVNRGEPFTYYVWFDALQTILPMRQSEVEFTETSEKPR